MPKNAPFQRAKDAPSLPNSTIKFIFYCLAGFRGWAILMMILEIGQATGSILVPYAIKAIMDGVAHTSGSNVLESLREPLLLLLGLNIVEILSSRGSGAVLIVMGARLRQNTTRVLYTYL
jgi:ATP-binding cassette subfamily B protein